MTMIGFAALIRMCGSLRELMQPEREQHLHHRYLRP